MAGCGKGKVLLVNCSDSSSGEGNANSCCSIPRIADELNSNHLTIWRDPFDLSKLPQGITLELVKRAPFLMGSDNATNSKEFFRTVEGLCSSGIPYQSLMADHGVPMEDLVGTYPLSRAGNRHPMKLITDRAAARNALHMYQRVYGGTQPDNGEFGTSFIRGLTLFFQRNTKVDWAEQAGALARKRTRNPCKNPQKLTPPCFRKQIQAMLDLFEVFLRRAYKQQDRSVSSAALPQKARSSLVIRLPNPELARPPSAVVQRSPLQVLIGKRRLVHRAHLDGLKLLEDARNVLAQHEQ